jgi:hypothetical protein
MISEAITGNGVFEITNVGGVSEEAEPVEQASGRGGGELAKLLLPKMRRI